MHLETWLMRFFGVVRSPLTDDVVLQAKLPADAIVTAMLNGCSTVRLFFCETL